MKLNELGLGMIIIIKASYVIFGIICALYFTLGEGCRHIPLMNHLILYG